MAARMRFGRDSTCDLPYFSIIQKGNIKSIQRLRALNPHLMTDAIRHAYYNKDMTGVWLYEAMNNFKPARKFAVAKCLFESWPFEMTIALILMINRQDSVFNLDHEAKTNPRLCLFFLERIRIAQQYSIIPPNLFDVTSAENLLLENKRRNRCIRGSNGELPNYFWPTLLDLCLIWVDPIIPESLIEQREAACQLDLTQELEAIANDGWDYIDSNKIKAVVLSNPRIIAQSLWTAKGRSTMLLEKAVKEMLIDTVKCLFEINPIAMTLMIMLSKDCSGKCRSVVDAIYSGNEAMFRYLLERINIGSQPRLDLHFCSRSILPPSLIDPGYGVSREYLKRIRNGDSS